MTYLVKYRPENDPEAGGFNPPPPREIIIHSARGVSWAWMTQKLAERVPNAQLVSFELAPQQPPERQRAPSSRGQRGAR